MYCAKCGAILPENEQVCPQCQFDNSSLQKPAQAPFQVDQTLSVHQEPLEHSQWDIAHIIRLCIYCLLALVVLILSFVAAGKISEAGLEIMQIESVGGKTLDEAYYYRLGELYSGYALFARSIGIFFASVLAWLGFRK